MARAKTVARNQPSEATLRGLRRFNAIMGVLHLLQGVLMIVLSNATTYPIFTNFLKFDVATRSLIPNPVLAYELRYGPAVAVFLLISAAAHFSLATFGYGWYVRHLKLGMNPARFYEYALSSSLMIVLIGMLVGIWDLGTMILMFGINAMMNLFGHLMELHNQNTKKTDWTSFIYGCFAGALPWVVIILSWSGRAPRLERNRPPSSTRSSRPSSCSSTASPSTWCCSTRRSAAGATTSSASASTSS